MNCDQVFAELTRGPFPTGAPTDLEVEDHLEHCAGCWRIAEALRPDRQVQEESVPAGEWRQLPGYWGDAVPGRSALVEVQQTALRTVALPRSARRSPVAYYVPRDGRETVGWREVARITCFLLVLGSAAYAVAWWWQ